MSTPATQSASLRAIRAKHADLSQQTKVKNCLRDVGPLIKDDIATLLDMRHSSVTARLNELVNRGEVLVKSIVFNPATNRNVSLYALA